MRNVNKILNVSEIFLYAILQRWWRLVALRVPYVACDASSILQCVKNASMYILCIRCTCSRCDQLLSLVETCKPHIK